MHPLIANFCIKIQVFYGLGVIIFTFSAPRPLSFLLIACPISRASETNYVPCVVGHKAPQLILFSRSDSGSPPHSLPISTNDPIALSLLPGGSMGDRGGGFFGSVWVCV